MKIQLIFFFVLSSCFVVQGQDRIIYELDSYTRVDGDYRRTLVTPNAKIEYKNTVNDPNQLKILDINFGASHADYQIINNRDKQKTKSQNVEFDLSTGAGDRLLFNYDYSVENRSYSDNKYFKGGYYIRWNSDYNVPENNFKTFKQRIEMNYDLGFGFGRIEIINDAWIGARILEELRKKNLLSRIPEAEEMKSFFDFLGDLSFERVMDNRLRTIYRLEEMIKFLEEKEWIEKGSIPAFATVYDAFRYENFILRKSGERLEFTLTPMLFANFNYIFTLVDPLSKYIQPGFEGKTEYEIDRNGDLEYYTTKLLGGRFSYKEQLIDDGFGNTDLLMANAYFEYQYNYLPSLRTNLTITGNISPGFVKGRTYMAFLNMFATLTYKYYFSPATQLLLNASVAYRDDEFQIGDYQPQILGNFSMNVVHAIR